MDEHFRPGEGFASMLLVKSFYLHREPASSWVLLSLARLIRLHRLRHPPLFRVLRGLHGVEQHLAAGLLSASCLAWPGEELVGRICRPSHRTERYCSHPVLCLLSK